MSPYFSILAILVLLRIPLYLCQNNEQYETCRRPFDCSGITEITYPFWGGDRLPSCGHPDFELNCQGNNPLLNISSTPYRVLDIDNSIQTLRIARDDLWDTICPTFLFETTLDSTLFRYSSSSNDQNISLYYGCTADQEQPIPNQFSCDINGTSSSSFYSSSGLGNGISCNRTITVPVNQTAAMELANPTVGSTSLLRDALMAGFSIQWSANDDENCVNCERSGGVCGYNQDTELFACYCADRPYDFTCNNTLTGNNGFAVVLIVLTLIVILIITLITMAKKKKENEYNHKKIEIFLKNYGNLAPKRYKYSQLKKMTKSFSDNLGKGGYGTVYKGKLHDGRLVAVKLLNESRKNGEDFVNEVASISRTSHINIVTLLGFCFEGSKRALIYEFMPNGSLDKFISIEAHLGWEKLFEIVVGIARGLEYLHRGCNMRILHLDIKPQNILLDKDFHPRIADFGLAKLCPDTASMVSMTGARGTVGYIAPEVFCRNFGEVSHKSDVYSYGMMVLEIVGERINVDLGVDENLSEAYFPHWVYKHLEVDTNEEDPDGFVEDDPKRKLTIVGLWCIQTDPNDRPSIRRVVEMLEGKVECVEIPPKPYLSSPTRPAVDVSTYESSDVTL